MSILCQSGLHFGAFWDPGSPLGTKMEPWVYPDVGKPTSGCHFELSWALFCTTLAPIGTSLGHLGPPWDHFGVIFGAPEPQKRHQNTVKSAKKKTFKKP